MSGTLARLYGKISFTKIVPSAVPSLFHSSYPWVPSYVKQDTLYFYFGEDVAPQGYFWVFPKGDNVANIGLGVSGMIGKKRSAQSFLNSFMEKHYPDAPIITKVAGGVPSTITLDKISAPGIALVGDAARQVNPLSGGGIASGMIGGSIAGRIAAEAIKMNKPEHLLTYDKAWHDRLGHRHVIFNKIKEGIFNFSDEKFKTDFWGEYLLGDYRTYGITVRAFDKLKILFGESDSYGELTTTILALFFKEDFRDYYYTKGFDATIEGEVAPVLSLSLGFTNHTDNSATTNTDFSIFNKSRTFRENPPVFEGKINAITAGFNLDFRDYIEDGYFRRRTSQGGSFVLFSGDVTFSNADLLGSNLDYTTYKFRSNGFIRTFRSAKRTSLKSKS